ncbi:MAG: thioredoxin family protein [Bacteroidales bacterium]|nr:thioredoxin family protein [Bacteroidales bacterium]
MKRLLFLATAITIALSACAQGSTTKNIAAGGASAGNSYKGIIWEDGTLMQALNKAGKDKKLLFLDCYATWCGPCKYMATQVFTTKEAGDYFNSNFVNIKIDMEKGEGINLARELRLQGYPTFIIMNSNGKEIGRIVGGAPIGQFIEKVKAIIK